jgi:hypothetical protein
MSKGRREFTMTPFEDEPGDDDDPPDDAGSKSGGENEDCNVEKEDRNEQEDDEEEDSEQWETPAKRRSAPVKRIWELEASYNHQEVQREAITVLIREKLTEINRDAGVHFVHSQHKDRFKLYHDGDWTLQHKWMTCYGHVSNTIVSCPLAKRTKCKFQAKITISGTKSTFVYLSSLLIITMLSFQAREQRWKFLPDTLRPIMSATNLCTSSITRRMQLSDPFTINRTSLPKIYCPITSTRRIALTLLAENQSLASFPSSAPLYSPTSLKAWSCPIPSAAYASSAIDSGSTMLLIGTTAEKGAWTSSRRTSSAVNSWNQIMLSSLLKRMKVA